MMKGMRIWERQMRHIQIGAGRVLTAAMVTGTLSKEKWAGLTGVHSTDKNSTHHYVHRYISSYIGSDWS